MSFKRENHPKEHEHDFKVGQNVYYDSKKMLKDHPETYALVEANQYCETRHRGDKGLCKEGAGFESRQDKALSDFKKGEEAKRKYEELQRMQNK